MAGRFALALTKADENNVDRRFRLSFSVQCNGRLNACFTFQILQKRRRDAKTTGCVLPVNRMRCDAS